MGVVLMSKPKISCLIGDMLEKEGRSQAWLAKQIGATKQQVNNWCSAEGSIPSIGYIMRIMKATSWGLEEMFREEE